MTTYEFTALDIQNSIRRGTVRGWTKRHASRQLKAHNLAVVTLAKMSQARNLNFMRLRVTRMDRIVFTRNLYTMMKAGLNLVESLASSREQSASPTLRKIIAEAEQNVLAGQPLSATLARHPRIFHPVYQAMVHIGERSGKLSEVLEFLTKQQENDYRLIRRIRNAMTYPLLIVVTLIAMVTLMMIFVIPKIAAVYAESNVSLPLYTKLLIGLSDFIANYIVYLLAGLAVLVTSIVYSLRKSIRFRRFVHKLILVMPVFGLTIKKVNLAVITRSLSMLTRSGLSIDEGLVLAGRSAGNILYQDAMKAAAPFVRHGVRLHDVFKGTNDLFLPVFQKMVATGEQTGNLDDMFEHIARYYDEDVEHWTTNISALIEPTLLLLTGVIVGSIAVAVLYPLWNFANVI